MDEPAMEIDANINENLIPGETEAAESISHSETDDQIVFQHPTLFTSKTLLELCNSSWSPAANAKHEVQPYLRGCKWSPDGTCCLTVVNNDGVHITELPPDLYTGNVDPQRNVDILNSVVHVKEAGLVYDFCWYPGMNSQIPETCCWITTKQNAPVQMWDAFDGSLRCSYRGFNAFDEMEPAVCVTFSSDATRIIAGYKKVLRTFDIDRPGREFAEYKISSPAACMATDSNLVAIGSWNTTISLYNINEIGSYKSIGKMHGHSGGVTHMKFTPDGLKLVSGARKDHRLLVWDIRYYRRPLNILSRVVDTNQRVYFDISPCGNYLVSGGTDGIIKVWDIEQVNWKRELDVTELDVDKSVKFPLHKDCCNSVSIHPLRPILATGSGQRHFKDPVHLLENEHFQNNTEESVKYFTNHSSVISETSQEINLSQNHESTAIHSEDMKYSSFTENCLVFWWIGDQIGDVPSVQ